MEAPEALLGLTVGGRWPLERFLGAGPRSWCFASGSSALKLRRPKPGQGLQPLLALKRRRLPGILPYFEVGVVHSGPAARAVYTVEPLAEPIEAPDLEVGKALLALVEQLEQRRVQHGRIRGSNIVRWQGQWLLTDVGCSDLDEQFCPTGLEEFSQPDVAAIFHWLTLPEPPPGMRARQALSELEEALREAEADSRRLQQEITLTARGPVTLGRNQIWIGDQGFDLYSGLPLHDRVASAFWRRSALSPDGRLLALADDHRLLVLRSEDRSLLAELPLPQAVQALSFDGSGRWLRVGLATQLQLYALSDRRQTSAVDLDGNGRVVLLSSHTLLHGVDSRLRCYSLSARGAELRACLQAQTGAGSRNIVEAAVLEEETGRLVTGWTDGALRVASLHHVESLIADLRTRAAAEAERLKAELDQSEDPAARQRLSQRLSELERSYMGGLPPVPVREVARHGSKVLSLALSSDRRYCYSVSEDGTLKVFQWPSFSCLGELCNSFAREVLCPEDPEIVVLVTRAGTRLLPRPQLVGALQPVLERFQASLETRPLPHIRQVVRWGDQLWVLTTEQLWRGDTAMGAATRIAGGAGGLATALDTSVTLYSPDGEVQGTLAHPVPVIDLAWTGNELVTLGQDATLRFWTQQAQCRELRKLPAMARRLHVGTDGELVLELPSGILRCSPGGELVVEAEYELLAASPRDQLVCWSGASRLTFSYPGPARHRPDVVCRGIRALQFSPAGMCLGAALENELVLWHADNHRELLRLPLRATGLSFPGEGELLAWNEDELYHLRLEPIYG